MGYPYVFLVQVLFEAYEMNHGKFTQNLIFKKRDDEVKIRFIEPVPVHFQGQMQ